MTGAADAAEPLRRHLVRRGAVLEAVLDGTDRRRALRDQLSITASTLDRTLARFESAGLLRRDRGVVEPTLGGRLAAESTRRFRRRVGAVFDAGDLLATFPAEVDVQHELLVGATLVRGSEGNHAPGQALRAAVGEPRTLRLCVATPATEVWGALGLVGEDSSTGDVAGDETATKGGLETPVMEVVYSPDRACDARERWFRANYERASEGRYRAYEAGDVDVDLLLVDADDGRRVVVPVVDDGTLVGVIVNDTEQGVACAERTFEERRAGATEFTGEFLPGEEVGDGGEPRDAVDSSTTEPTGVATDDDSEPAPSAHLEASGRSGAENDERVDWVSRYRLLSQTSEILAALLDGARDKRDVTRCVSVTRSTVDRAVRKLVSHGLVGQEGVSAGATATGRLAHEATEAYQQETDAVLRAGGLLSGLDPETPIDIGLLLGASMERTETDGNLQTYRAALEAVMTPDAETVYACSYAITDTSAPSAASRLVMDLGTTLHVVYRRSVADYIRSAHGGKRREMSETGRYRAFVTPTLPFGLFLVETSDERRVAVTVYDDTTTLVGTIVNDSEAAVEWATRTYERYRDTGEEITADFLDTGTGSDT